MLQIRQVEFGYLPTAAKPDELQDALIAIPMCTFVICRPEMNECIHDNDLITLKSK